MHVTSMKAKVKIRVRAGLNNISARIRLLWLEISLRLWLLLQPQLE